MKALEIFAHLDESHKYFAFIRLCSNNNDPNHDHVNDHQIIGKGDSVNEAVLDSINNLIKEILH